MVEKYVDRIAKERLNIILIVDASKSMGGERISQVNNAIKDIINNLSLLQNENSNVDFYLSIIPFSNKAYLYNNQMMINVNEIQYKGIETGGWTNLHEGYIKLKEILKKESQGGMMPDFGGVAPIILLLTDGHPTGNEYKEKLQEIQNIPWFKVALRYGIAIELYDQRTTEVLRDFVGNNGDVIKCYNSSMLKNIIKIVVLSASKVKSASSNVTYDSKYNKNDEVKQVIAEALSETENWEW